MESDQIDIKDLAADEYRNLHELAISLIDSIFSNNDPQNIEMSENQASKENLETKSWLSTIVNKYAEKVEADQTLLERNQQELQTLQISLLNFEEQNSFLRDMYQDAQGKMNQLQAFLDETEANNEALQEKVLKYETKCNQLESQKDSAKKPIRSVSLNEKMISDRIAANATRELQEEIESKKSQIKTLQETVALQEGLIEKLQQDVGRYIDLEDKYEQLKKDLSYLMSLKTLTDQIDPEKLKFDRKSISVHNEPTSANENSNVLEQAATHPTNRSFASSTEGENLNLLVKGQSLSPNNSKSVRRQKSLAEDLRSTKASEDLKGVSPFSRSRILRPKPASQAQFNFKSNDFTNTTTHDHRDSGFQRHKHTKTISTFETDGFTPEIRSPDNNVIESDIEDEFLDVFRNHKDLSDDGSHGRGKALMRWLDEADPKISEKDAESPISVKSRQTIESVESQKNVIKIETENISGKNRFIAQDKLSPYFGTLEPRVRHENHQITRKIDLGRSSAEAALKNQKDLAQEIGLYINREKFNAINNTKFSVISLLKVLVFGVRHGQ